MVDELLEYHNTHFDSTLTDDDYWEMEHSEVPRELYDVCIDGICDPLITEFGNHSLYFYYEYVTHQSLNGNIYIPRKPHIIHYARS